jgi:GTP-binding protein LepA
VAPDGATTLVTTPSLPVSGLVGEILSWSDNTAAELVSKEIGLQVGGAGTTEAGTAATLAHLGELGLPTAGVTMTDGSGIELHNPVDMPDVVKIARIEEPWIRATILVPDAYLGAVLALCEERRGEQIDLTYVGNRAMVVYRLPLNEVVYDFYDRLKSVTRGYASFDYQLDTYREGDLVKVQIMVNAEPVDALSMIVPRSNAETRGRQVCERLKDLIPRQLFKIPIQAAIGGKVIARETISAMRKDVTAKCYGGDVSRKRKLLEKQKKGKARMREYGNVSIPQEAFIAALRMGEE